MNHIDFSEFHNYLIEFKYKGSTKGGVVINKNLFPAQKGTEYLYIPAKNLLSWRAAESENDVTLLKTLCELVDILLITDARRIELRKNDIERRVKDWKNRINELYDNISEWISEKHQYKLIKKNDQTIDEALTRQFNTSTETLPSADIYKEKTLIMSIKPSGLWLIGANGRLDVISQNNNYTIIDSSDNFRATDWHIYESSNKKDRKKFVKSAFLNLLSK